MRHFAIALFCALSLSQAALAKDPPKPASAGVGVAGGELEVRATVVELDKAHRTLVLKGPKGKVVTLSVPAEVKNFDEIRVGDQLVLRYAAAVAAKLEPVAHSDGIRERVETAGGGTAPAGSMPAVGASNTVEVLAVVQAFDRKAGTVTLRGVSRTVTVRIPDGMDTSKLKVGSEVRALITEAAVLSVERPAKK
jgi:hypothetical protein